MRMSLSDIVVAVLAAVGEEADEILVRAEAGTRLSPDSEPLFSPSPSSCLVVPFFPMAAIVDARRRLSLAEMELLFFLLMFMAVGVNGWL